MKKRYKITYFKKHYLHKEVVALSIEEATSLAWANAPKDSWVDAVKALNKEDK